MAALKNQKRIANYSGSVSMDADSKVEMLANGGAIIKGCKVNSNRSLNKSLYPDPVLEAATPHYEGVKVWANHSETGSFGWGPRAIESRMGRIKNVTWPAGGGGHRADFHVLPSAVKAGFVDDVKADPTIMGFSHVVWCDVADKPTDEGYEVITKIHKVESVDVVGEPATTRGMFESANQGGNSSRRNKERKMPGDDEKDPSTKLIEMLQGQVKEKEDAVRVQTTTIAAKEAEITGLKATVTDLKTKLEVETAKAAKVESEVRETKIEAALKGLPETTAKDMRESLKALPLEAALRVVESIKKAGGASTEPPAPRSEGKSAEAATGTPAPISEKEFLNAF